MTSTMSLRLLSIQQHRSIRFDADRQKITHGETLEKSKRLTLTRYRLIRNKMNWTNLRQQEPTNVGLTGSLPRSAYLATATINCANRAPAVAICRFCASVMNAR